MSTIPELTKHAREAMHKAVDATKRELTTIRSGKATTSLLDLVRVEAYGSQVPLNQVGLVSAPEPRLLTVQPFDKGLSSAIEKAIREADLGLNPSTQGNLIRVPLPPLSEERRRDLVKMAKSKGEDAKVAIRNIRRRSKEELDRIVKDGEAGEDDVRRAEKELDDLTSQHVHSIDEAVKNKESELLEV